MLLNRRVIGEQAVGAHTAAGTWAADEDEAKIVEMIADRDESWSSSLSGKEQWLRAPASDHGMLRSGTSLALVTPHFRTPTCQLTCMTRLAAHAPHQV